MEEYDVVILGASGFTGKWVAREFSRFAENTKWAISGRNIQRLNALVEELELKVDCIVADISDFESLDRLCEKTKLLVNCTGPYRTLGEPVFKACVKSGTDYLDLCGEPEFIEAMEMKYNEEAGQNGCIAISGCGFDSIPSDVGLNFLKSNFGGELQSVESFLQIDSAPGYCGHATTWDCAVMGFGNQDALRALRRINQKKRIKYVGQGLKQRSFGSSIQDVPTVTGRAITFPGSDVSIVRRSQQLFESVNAETPIRYYMYAVVEDLTTVVSIALGGLLLSILSKFTFGQNLLKRFVNVFSFGVFSREGPSLQSVEKTTFSIHMVGRGVEKDVEKEICKHMLIEGPEPGYDATSKILVSAIRTLLEERDIILNNLAGSGGVTTTAFAFQKTNIIGRLQERGINFNMLN